MAKPKKEIVIGQEYGWLTVLNEEPKDSIGHRMFRVRCRCGKEYSSMISNLTENRKCKECSVKYNVARRQSEKLGTFINGWEILEVVGKNTSGVTQYLCRCPKCGYLSIHTIGNLKYMRGKGCHYCPPMYSFEIDGDTAIGILPDGSRFMIDADMVDSVSNYHWSLNDAGYIKCNDKCFHKMLLHWFVIGMAMNHDEIIDHINRDKLDCRRDNLRIVTIQQNAMNRSIGRNNISGYVGVSFDKSKGKYKAKISLNNKSIYLGYSTDSIRELP